MSKVNAVTSLGQAPDQERARRFLIYTVSMVIRFACVILVVFTTGIWQWIFGLGAVFLPYFAVVIGNNSGGSAKQSEQAVKVEPLAIDVGSFLKRDK
jgi:predicted tellurium resistance membrane protein TerC